MLILRMGKQFLHRMLAFSTGHARVVVILTLILTAVLGYFAAKVRINSDFSSLLPEDAEINRLIRTYGGNNPRTELLVVAIQGEDIFSLSTLEAFSQAVDQIAALPAFTGVISPFNLLSFRKNESGRLEIGPAAAGGKSPEDEEQLAAFRGILTANRFAGNLVVSQDGSLLAAFFRAPRQGGKIEVMEEVRAITAALRRTGLRVLISGSIPFAERTEHYISRDSVRLILLAAVFILFFYYIGFRTARAVLLPMMVLGIGTLWAVGFMGIFGMELTLISIVAPPLIMIFGNEYSIYVLQEYFRSAAVARNKGTTVSGAVEPRNPRWIEQVALRVTRPIAMAFITTVIGYLSLCITAIRQTQEFAVVASVGSFACGFLALFFLPALLSFFRPPDGGRTRRLLEDPLARLTTAAASLARRPPHRILMFLPVLVVVFLISVRFLTFNTDSITYFPQNDPFIQDMYALTGKIGGFDEIQLTYVAPEGQKNYFTAPDLLRQIEAVEQTFRDHPDVCYTISPASILGSINLALRGVDEVPDNPAVVRLMLRLMNTVGAAPGSMAGNLIDEDFSRLTVKLRIYNSSNSRFMDEYRFREFLSFMQATVSERAVGAAHPVIWGEILRKLSLADILRRFLVMSMLISLASIFLVTSLTFRSFLHGLYAVVPLACGLMVNFVVMTILHIPLDMTTIMVANITIGVGIDNGIYLLLQYRRDLQHSEGRFQEAIGNTLRVMGRAALLSTIAVALALLVFTTSAFKPIVYFGLLVIVSLSATTAATLTVLPALLAFDQRIRTRGSRAGAAGS